jgi:Flp pilus assembly protein TadD
LAGALHRSNLPREAIPHYQLALVRRPDDAELYNNLGAAWAQLGELDEAILQFRRALELQPNFADAQRNLNQAVRAGASAPTAQPPDTQP